MTRCVTRGVRARPSKTSATTPRVRCTRVVSYSSSYKEVRAYPNQKVNPNPNHVAKSDPINPYRCASWSLLTCSHSASTPPPSTSRSTFVRVMPRVRVRIRVRVRLYEYSTAVYKSINVLLYLHSYTSTLDPNLANPQHPYTPNPFPNPTPTPIPLTLRYRYVTLSAPHLTRWRSPYPSWTKGSVIGVGVGVGVGVRVGF